MPAVIDPVACNRNFDQCFPARICPEHAISLEPNEDVSIDSSLCGECPGPCVNFCDGYAIRYDPDPVAFEILEQTTLGLMSDDEAVQARAEIQEQAAEAIVYTVTDVTADTFDAEVMQANLPVVIDFWAPWCGPCKQMAPIFEELAGEYDGRMKFVKINTEDEQLLASQFQITSIPTLYILHHGQLIDGSVGALSKDQLRAVFDRALETTGDLQSSPGIGL